MKLTPRMDVLSDKSVAFDLWLEDEDGCDIVIPLGMLKVDLVLESTKKLHKVLEEIMGEKVQKMPMEIITAGW